MSRDADSFLSRWSARKQAVREAEADESVEPVVEPAQPDPEKSDAEILEELGLKDPDEMSEGDDFSGFMSSTIPERLRNRALRKLWLTNPVLANLDELVDYGEDFTDAATVVENLQTAYRVGKGFLRREEIEAAEAAAADGEPDDSVEVAEAELDDPDGADGEAEAAFSSDGSGQHDEVAVDSNMSDQTEAVAEMPSNALHTPEEPYVPRQRRMVFRTS